MGKQAKRWPIWKIAVATAACAAGAVGLFMLSAFMGGVHSGDEADPSEPTAVLPFPTFVMILGVAVSMLAVLCVIWLVVRIQDARTPVWEKRGKKRKRR